MDPAIFSTLLSRLKKEPFTDGKMSALRSFTQYQFTAAQTVDVIGCFPHASDKTKVLATIAHLLVTLNGFEGKAIIEAFTFSSGKLEALELIASHVNDPANKYVIEDAFTFNNDKKKARQILDKIVVAPLPPPPCGLTFSTGVGVGGAGGGGYQPQLPYQQPPSAGSGYQPPPQTYPPPPQQDYQPPPQTYPPPQGYSQQPQGYGPSPHQAYQAPPQQQGYPSQQPPPPQTGGASGVQFGFGVGMGGFPTVQATFDLPSGVAQPPPPGTYPPPQGQFPPRWP